MDRSDELRQRANRIRDKLGRTRDEQNRDPLKRPVFVEFAGTPKSGKSTCIDIVAHFFRRLGYKVLAPTEGASRRTPYYLKDDLVAFNTWSASYALMHVLEGIHGSDEYDLAILDRGLFDALAWFQLLSTEGRITTEVRDKVQSFLLIDTWRSKIDAVLMFTTDPDTALSREVSDKIITDEGRAMNPAFLAQLNGAYEQVQVDHADAFTYFTTIDTSDARNSSPRSTAVEAVTRILDVFESSLTSDKDAE